MSEAKTRSTCVKLLKSLHGTPIESQRTGVGIPDVFFIGGVVEVKWLASWPKREESQVRPKHPLTREQHYYLKTHVKMGGAAWVLFQVGGNSWLLFSPENATVLRRGHHVDRETLLNKADFCWIGVPPAREFVNAVTCRIP